jgi:hypothetical protein
LIRTAVSLTWLAAPVDAPGAGVLGLEASVATDSSLPTEVPAALLASALKW